MPADIDPIKSWEVRTSTGRHFDFLDGLRGIAILMVVSTHTFYINPKSGLLLHFFDEVVKTGWMGVPIFFVLSGFLISYPFFRERAKNPRFWHLPGYARRRIGKIIPPFYLTLGFLTTYYLIRFRDPGYIAAALQWALGLANFAQTTRDFQGPYWSLIVEVQFYLLLPFLFFVFRGFKPMSTALGLFAILLVTPLIARQLTWPGDPFTLTEFAFDMRRFPCQLDFFGWGVLFAGGFVFLSGARDNLSSLARTGYVGLVLFVGVILFQIYCFSQLHSGTHPTRWNIEAFHLLPAAATFLMLFFVFDPHCLGSRCLAQPWLRFVGVVSYEWFLFHLPIVHLFYYLIGDGGGNPLIYLIKTILPLSLTFMLSVVVYRYFSLPLMNWIRGDMSFRGKLPVEAKVEALK